MMEIEVVSDKKEPRTIEQIDKVADKAGLSRRRGMVQTLHFTDDLSNSEFRLVEISKDILNKTKEGDCFVIRGDANEDAVLCTQNETFEIKAADTSNLLMLLPDLKTPKSSDFAAENKIHEVEICDNLYSYYELKKIRPKIEKLKHLLEEAKFAGPEHDEQFDGQKLTFEDLQQSVQASDEEIRFGLHKFGAFQLQGNVTIQIKGKGCWRLLDISYKEKAFSQILKLLDEEGWNYWEIPLRPTCDILEELYPRYVIEHCLDQYGQKSESCDKDGVFYSLIEDKVCQFFAECILRGAERFNRHEFFEAWTQCVPDGMKTNKEQLKGLALEDINCHPSVIWHFPASELPAEPSERFEKLFRVRSKWTRQDIQPYISELCGQTQSMNALLLKYARCSTDALGNKVYNSKRPIS